MLGKKYNVFDKELSMKLSKKEKVINFFQLIKNILSNALCDNLKKVDTLIFSHPRSKLVEDTLIDPYTHYLVKSLIKNNISFLEFESPHNGKHLREKKHYKIYLDSIFIIRNIKNLFIKTNISQKNKTIVEQLSKYKRSEILYISNATLKKHDLLYVPLHSSNFEKKLRKSI